LLIKCLAPLLTAAIAVAVSAGCGGDSESQTYSVEAATTVTTAPVAKAGYVSRINKMCREAWVVIYDNFAEYSSWQNSKLDETKRFSDSVRSSLIPGIVFHIFDEIHNLGAPPGEKREVEEMIGSMQSASERGEKKLAPVSSIAQVTDLYDEYNQRASRYGFANCLIDEAHLRKLELET
jgi:hypothetical protein